MHWLHLDHCYLVGPRPSRASARAAIQGSGKRVVAEGRAAFQRRDAYVTRSDAVVALVIEHLPLDRSARADWWEQRCASVRRDGRVQERLILSLPVELGGAHAEPVARAVMHRLGGGRVPYVAAIHRGDLSSPRQHGEAGRENLHLHVDWADADHETGRVVFGACERGSTRRIRRAVAEALNRYAEENGLPVRVDPRRLREQHAEAVRRGDAATAAALDRRPGIKVGPALRVAERGELRSDYAREKIAVARRREEEKRDAEERAAALRRAAAAKPLAAIPALEDEEDEVDLRWRDLLALGPLFRLRPGADEADVAAAHERLRGRSLDDLRRSIDTNAATLERNPSPMSRQRCGAVCPSCATRSRPTAAASPASWSSPPRSASATIASPSACDPVSARAKRRA